VSSPANFGLGSGVVSNVYGLGCTTPPEREREGEGKNEEWGFVDDERRDLIWCFGSYLSWCNNPR
jgi:hypothetical protein